MLRSSIEPRGAVQSSAGLPCACKGGRERRVSLLPSTYLAQEIRERRIERLRPLQVGHVPHTRQTEKP